jgi:threonylcarbamoyladenosine tRNA methylthiotransferase MtaB
MPHACIGVDVIVGFPSETDDDFLDTYNFINALDISYLHVFTYSERQNTKAIEIGGVVPMSVRNERNAMLRTLSEKKKRFFYQQFLGKTAIALLEQERNGNNMHGFTDNYIKVTLPYNAAKVNQVVNIQLNDFDDAGNVCAVLIDK